jgi:hypothetical protein
MRLRPLAFALTLAGATRRGSPGSRCSKTPARSASAERAVTQTRRSGRDARGSARASVQIRRQTDPGGPERASSVLALTRPANVTAVRRRPSEARRRPTR